MSAPSKNQRVGKRSVERKQLCGRGHEMTWVRTVPVFGRAQMVLVCECNGFYPIALKK